MKRIEDMIKSGEIKGAAAELQKLLAAEPYNAEAKMLYGTCCHLLGDDKTFCSIHDELAPKMGKERSVLWQLYCREIENSYTDPMVLHNYYARTGMVLMEWLLMAGLVAAALAVAAYLFVREASNGSLYAGPAVTNLEVVNGVKCPDPSVDESVYSTK